MIKNRYTEATYRKTGMPQYDGNPLIEALPAILTEIEVVRYVGHTPPKPDQAELALSPKLRSHGINRLRDLVVPMDIHLELEDSFSQLIRYGYTAREPFSPSTIRYRVPAKNGLHSNGFKSSANIMTLIGLSGMGKTTALDAISKLYPQVIQHSKYKGNIFIETQVVWLKLECPHDGSLGGFCAAFFASLDTALGIHKYSDIVVKHPSVSKMLQIISQLCKAFYIGAIIIDEMQHLNTRGGRDREKLLNFFVTLSNDTGVPLVYVGTNAMLPLFSGVLRNARRAVGMGEITFDRFSVDSPFWELLVNRVWEYDWTGGSTALSEELFYKIYDLSQGNTDFLIKLIMLTQRYAIAEGVTVLTTTVMQRVYDNQMRMLHKPIEALRSGDPLQIAEFEDLMPTKDQISLMMKYDLKRRAQRADMSIYNNSSVVPTATKPKAVGKPVVAVDVPSNIHLSPGADVAKALQERGWVDESSEW
ncbi:MULTISPECIES: ATP-binding protein [Pseudomonas]|uniref:ATP-binding protein n=3 Tax=Pseudomonas TaxID=286 RepID=A0AAW6PRB7_PSEPU|nr:MULTISPECIES: ATP-binding protein [Pseudomonas]MCE0778725.1 ATP-binding protein [Pseudomonas sp. NMI542_15]MDF3872651.1 ATP-binding protein [Pseudomonas putida]MDF3878863.1 ATP-binding protein [Pseudomonas putida]MDH0025172.1 ATP-binding protein [Pseudomonas monteilii]